MTRIRSRGYPNQPLEQVIDNARKVHEADRQHPVDRETVARHIGFGGLSGASDRALSALLHYGLMEKVKKGELRVTDLALAIIHPHNDDERRQALHQAGFSPDLFQELRERYPETPPSRESLSSYLLRSGFATAAIPAATKAFLETCSFLQRERAYDLGVATSEPEPEPEPIQETPMLPQPSVIPATLAAGAMPPQPQVSPTGRSDLNKINMDIRGEQVFLSGLLDVRGLKLLRKRIDSLEALLAPLDPDDGAIIVLGDEERPN